MKKNLKNVSSTNRKIRESERKTDDAVVDKKRADEEAAKAARNWKTLGSRYLNCDKVVAKV
ncbi:MAG: hypothetical protein ACKO3K_07915 [Cuspidothrix sp.]